MVVAHGKKMVKKWSSRFCLGRAGIALRKNGMRTWSLARRLTEQWSEDVVANAHPHKGVVIRLVASRAPTAFQSRSLAVHRADSPLRTHAAKRPGALMLLVHRLAGSNRGARVFAKRVDAHIAVHMWNSARRRIQRSGGRQGHPRTKPTALPKKHKSANHRLPNLGQRGWDHKGPAGQRRCFHDKELEPTNRTHAHYLDDFGYRRWRQRTIPQRDVYHVYGAIYGGALAR